MPLLLGVARVSASPDPAALPDSVRLALVECHPDRAKSQATADALRMELESDGVRRVLGVDAAAVEAALEVRLPCTSDGPTEVTLVRTSTGNTAAATLQLSDVADDERPRVLALAAAELVHGYWAVLAERDATVNLAGGATAASIEEPQGAEDPVPATATALPAASATAAPATAASATAAPATALAVTGAPPSPTGTTPSTPTPPERERSGPAVGAAAAFRWFSLAPSFFGGGALELRAGFVRVGAEALVSDVGDRLGRVSSGVGAARVAAHFEILRVGSWAASLGPRGALGIAWASGTATGTGTGANASEAIGLYADAAAETELTFRSGGFVTALTLELGGARGLAALANDRTAAASGGFFLGSRLALQYSLP